MVFWGCVQLKNVCTSGESSYVPGRVVDSSYICTWAGLGCTRREVAALSRLCLSTSGVPGGCTGRPCRWLVPPRSRTGYPAAKSQWVAPAGIPLTKVPPDILKISGFITGEGSKTCFKACTLLLVSTLVFHQHVLRSICPLYYRPATWFRPSRVVKLWSSTTMCNTICSFRKPCSFICDFH